LQFLSNYPNELVYLFDVAGLVIFGQVFGPQQVVGVFGFSSFYFVGLGWFVVCVGVILFFL
jgi:hypothetical protein